MGALTVAITVHIITSYSINVIIRFLIPVVLDKLIRM